MNIHRELQSWVERTPRTIPLKPPGNDELSTLAAERNLTFEALALCRRRKFLWKILHHGKKLWALTEPKPDRRWLCIYWPMAMNVFPIKWTTESARLWPRGWANWPLGLIDAAARDSIAIVTCPSDFLAAWHFILDQGVKRVCTPVLLLSRQTKIPDGMAKCFQGKRVRIFPQVDSEHSSGISHAESTLMRQEELLRAGAHVDVFDLSGLWQAPIGEPAPDSADGTIGPPVRRLSDVAGMGLRYEESKELKSMMRF